VLTAAMLDRSAVRPPSASTAKAIGSKTSARPDSCPRLRSMPKT